MAVNHDFCLLQFRFLSCFRGNFRGLVDSKAVKVKMCFKLFTSSCNLTVNHFV